MTDPKGNNEYCFPEVKLREKIEFEGKQKSSFPAEPVINCFVIPPNSKLEKKQNKTRRKNVYFRSAGSQTLLSFQGARSLASVHVVVSLGS